MSDAVFTIIANNYLPFARVLMRSFRQFAPELRRIVILADRLEGSWDPAAEDFEVILSSELAIPDSTWFHFKYNIVELSTAVKPYAAQYLLDRLAIQRLLYFDPDIRLYRRPGELLEALDRHCILLTPHLTAPIRDEKRPGELDILRTGSYNLGFLALRDSAEVRRFLRWWQEKLFEHCVVDFAKGLFVDQRWVDLVPGLFDGVGILRDPEWNVAYWNLAGRDVRKTEEGYTVNGRPLGFFHFSGFDPENPEPFSKHQDRFRLEGLGDVRALAMDYRQRLLDSGYLDCRRIPYAYGWFANGKRIPGVARAVHHLEPSLPARLADPFSGEGYVEFVALWTRPMELADRRADGVTRLAYRIYQTRPDVQAAMPDLFGADRYRFLRWLLSEGKAEHFLNDDLVAPAVKALEGRGSRIEDDAPVIVNSRIAQAVLKARALTATNEPIDAALLNRIDTGGKRLRLTYLARAIHASRPDLQHTFPDPEGRDAGRFLLWFLTHGAREYRLAPELLRPMRDQWDGVTGSTENPIERLRLRMSLLYAQVQPWLRGGKRFHAVPQGSGIQTVRAALPSSSGLHLIGYVRSEMGMGEVVRSAARAAAAVGVPHTVETVDGPGPYRQQDFSVAISEGDSPFAVNVYCVNADALPAVLETEGGGRRGRYNIGYWAWELEEFPDRWQSSFGYLDEVWTISGFCQAAIAAQSPIPVVRMPLSVAVQDVQPMERGMFGIGAEPFLFLGAVDLLSIPARKNPLGLIEAFRAAFAGDPARHLLLKINHAEQRPEVMRSLFEAARGLPVTFVDRTISRAEMNGLLALSDCFVSLHRSEGFGLAIAEAMYLEKPVIATAYSGNMDFMTPMNSYLVDYDPGSVPPHCSPYAEGIRWAEPRLSHAVAQMRAVAGDAAGRRQRASEGALHIRTHFSPAVVGQKIADRIRRILHRRG